MLTAMDLTRSQMSRVIAQAVRLRAKLELEPYPDICSHLLWACVVGRESNCLQAQLVDGYQEGLPSALVGAYCDVRTVLSGQLYLFTTSVLEIQDRSNPPVLLLAEPVTMQVTNRRRFVRKAPTNPVTIELVSPGAASTVISGDLWNIGANGLAVRVARREGDQLLFIGDAVRVRFVLPWNDARFELEASVCTKSNTLEPDYLVAGLEFCTPECAAGAPDELRGRVGPVCTGLSNPAEQRDGLARLREIIAEETNRLLELEG